MKVEDVIKNIALEANWQLRPEELAAIVLKYTPILKWDVTYE